MAGMTSKLALGLSSRLSQLSVMPTHGPSILLPSSTFATKSQAGPPKRPTPTYMIFANQERPIIMRENPNWSLGELGRELGVRYRALNPAKKEAMEAQYQSALKAYKAEMDAFKATEAGKKYLEDKKSANAEKRLAKEKLAIKKLKEDLGRPKRPVSAFLSFNLANTDTSKPFGPQTKANAEKWKSMTDAQKAPFIAKTKELEEKYLKDIAAWEASLTQEQKEQLGMVKKAKKSKVSKKEK